MPNFSRHRQSPGPIDGAADSHPLKHAVICCTSVPDEKRTELAAFAEQMGAVHRFDLTIDVTHLIVGQYDTPKYRYVAKERPDVKPMTIDWIAAMRELWMNDQDVDVDALEKEHTLPTLHSLRLSMTGCDDPNERSEIAKAVQDNGGAYAGDLTKQFTHLISFKTDGAKYRAAKTWGLRIVSIEWLRDSLERGMILDEKLYDPALPIEKRGIGAWDRNKPKSPLGKRYRDSDNGAGTEGGKRKLRRTASAKLSSGNNKIWGDIVGGGTPQVNRSGVWETAATRTESVESEHVKKEPDLASFRTENHTQDIQGIFSSCRFFLDGFEGKKLQVLCDHMLPNGADICNSREDLARSGPNNTPMRLFRVIPSTTLEPVQPAADFTYETITEWWVEQCLHKKKFIDPSSQVIGRPFPKFPIPDFSDLLISSAAFSGIDLLHLKKAADLIGALYSEDMTRHSSVLLTKSVSGLRKDKADHAKEWNIPIVNADWLWECITAGRRLPYARYVYRTKERSESLPPIAQPAALPAAESTSSKSKPIGRSRSELTNTFSKPNVDVSAEPTIPRRNSRLDRTAFMTDSPMSVKEEEATQIFQLAADSSLTPLASHTPTQALTERSNNSTSPSRTVSTAPAPSHHPVSKESGTADADISQDISSLLAKTKQSTKPSSSDLADGRRRGANRILGRVASNLSNTSRASSVDSTATHGSPVKYPAGGPGKERFLDAGNDRSDTDESQLPPATQLHYDDPDAEVYKKRIAQRMQGEKVDSQRPFTRAKGITMGSAHEPVVAKTRRGRSGKTPGFR